MTAKYLNRARIWSGYFLLYIHFMVELLFYQVNNLFEVYQNKNQIKNRRMNLQLGSNPFIPNFNKIQKKILAFIQ